MCDESGVIIDDGVIGRQDRARQQGQQQRQRSQGGPQPPRAYGHCGWPSFCSLSRSDWASASSLA